VLPKLSHPIRACAALCFFNLGCFPFAVPVGRVGLFLVTQHGAMLTWAGREQKTMLTTSILSYVESRIVRYSVEQLLLFRLTTVNL
jgi:hypothetical protein